MPRIILVMLQFPRTDSGIQYGGLKPPILSFVLMQRVCFEGLFACLGLTWSVKLKQNQKPLTPDPRLQSDPLWRGINAIYWSSSVLVNGLCPEYSTIDTRKTTTHKPYTPRIHTPATHTTRAKPLHLKIFQTPRAASPELKILQSQSPYLNPSTLRNSKCC